MLPDPNSRQPTVIGEATVRVLWEPRDLWIGAYRDPAKGRVYICLVPCLPIVIERSAS